ncbi:MAG: efflux RND transporter permease subunit [Vulcanimicrobiaceae bacterium]
MIRFFLERPIFALVCSLSILLAGVVVIPSLPIAQFPKITPPVVTVTATYTGATAATVESSVTTPLEEAINGVDGLRYISSTSSSDGTSTILCTFALGKDLDIAASDVQNAVGTASARLPSAVTLAGVTVTKNAGTFVMAYGFSSTNPRYDTLFLSNYVDLNIVDALKRIPGVSNVNVFGQRKYAMRLWIDPKRLADYGLSNDDVVAALNQQNVQIAAGAIGDAPTAADQPFHVNIRAVGRLTTPEQFGNLLLRALPDGGYVRFHDVGRVELGAENYSQMVRFDGKTAVGIGVQALPTANALDVAKAVRAAMAGFEHDFPPGVSAKVAFDATLFVTESLKEVLITLALSIVLVVLVVFIFLQDPRTTLVPILTIPVSLVGTFAIMKVLGFSINTLTMFGLTLATGLVVDDAIVVIENIARFIQTKKMQPLPGATAAMEEITGAVVASSLVLLAVFVPVAFFPGTTGLLYRQFALTIAGSVLISLFIALTLTPVMSRFFLSSTEQHPAMFRPINAVIDATRRGYGRLLPVLVRGRLVVMAVFVLGLGATVLLKQFAPTGFLPDEDNGYFFVTAQLPEDASLVRTSRAIDKIGDIMRAMPEISDVFEVSGRDFGGNGANRALAFANLKPWADRQGAQHRLNGILARLRPQLAAVPEAQAFAFGPPAIQGFPNVAGFQFELEDRTNQGFAALAATSGKLIAAARHDPVLSYASTSFRDDAPQFVAELDRGKATTLQVPLQNIADALQISLGSLYVNDFDFQNRAYRVYVEADAPFRTRLDDLSTIYVRSSTGGTIPLSSLLTISQERTAPIITHYNLFRSVELNGVAKPGYGSGQALQAMQSIAAQTLPPGMKYDWSGLSLEALQGGSQSVLVFVLGVVVVFLVLAAKYESLTDPLTILMSVPLTIFGALLALRLRGFVSDVYAQVGFVMLIGLASKNGILIVEFANQLRRRGVDLASAAIEAAETRFRPILMTSLAFIFAILPLVFASGAGSTSRQSLGTTLFGGMIFATVLNLTFVPVLYVVIVRFRSRFSRQAATAIEEAGPPTIERSADGGLVVSFPNGGRPVRLRVPAVEEDDEAKEPPAPSHS